MKKKNILNLQILSLTALLISSASAKDHFYIIGGGGEPKKETTIFDDALTKLDFFLKDAPAWHTGIYFNGGHSKTEQIISSMPKDEPAKHFHPEDYDNFLQNTLKKMQNGEIKSGEKLLLFIDSHGAIRARNGNEISHSISSSEKGRTVNLDKLEDVLKLAHSKGIKVGLIDASCHAGATHDLQKFHPDMCVITASSERNFSYTDFAESIAANFKTGKNLEEIFHFARNASLAKGIPMINTPVGKVVQELTKDIHPIFFDPTYDPIGSSNNKLEAYIDQSIQGYGVCQEIPLPNNLMDAINKAEELSIVQKKFLFFTTTEKKEFKELKEMLQAHHVLLNQAKRKREKTLPLLEQKIKLDPPSDHMEYTWAEVARINYDKLIAESEEIINDPNTPADKKDRSETLVKFYRSIKSTHERLKKIAQFQAVEKDQKELENIYEQIGRSGTSIAAKERELYESLYKSLEKTELGKAPNPCRDFKL